MLVIVLEEQPDLLEHAFLAADVEVEQDVRLRQQLGDEIHVILGMSARGRAASPTALLGSAGA